MSKILQVASSWPGFSGLSYLVIFGDSYSSVGYDDAPRDCVSTALQPLGVPFPGSTWNEPDLPNWVGHLVTKYFPRPRFIPAGVEQDAAYLERPLLVYDYAKGGDTVTGVRRQIQSRFLPSVGQKPDWASWSSDNSLFITWIGINDCAYSRNHGTNVKMLFSLEEELYDAGARNFLFIDVPPIHRSPAVPEHHEDSTTFDNFNNELDEAVSAFVARHPNITVMLFSASATFNSFLDAPEAYGFRKQDCRRPGGRIWYDTLHPTSAVHDCVAKELAKFLGSVTKLQKE
ncbi:hypothetical protein LshimejAT787_0204570 [Lyophyllum shimeji]|uniref:Carbohydrate esterase family 16 protein n=1 Tax=Lyophyllum shimeji TaxID=47721 RepID=A0A9P3PGC7_LYOSH|nr:hypothetical protein LshimejAT787_0204570 [Lyophyllum shimeji]